LQCPKLPAVKTPSQPVVKREEVEAVEEAARQFLAEVESMWEVLTA
jgi:hypothetical protein